MDFLVRVELSAFATHRRCFVAEMDGRVVGFAAVVPVPARRGWFIEDLIRAPDAPNGTGELLVDAVMRWAAATGSTWITLGLAPLAGEVAPALRVARRGGALLYDFEGLRTFKAKLRPGSWSSISLSYPPTQGAAVSIADALVAFTRGGVGRFAVRSLLRRPRAMLVLLAALLAPWTALLAAAPTEPWFPSPAVKWAWVGFDLALALGLFRVLSGGSRRLTGALAVAVGLDALLTWTQAVLWNVERVRGPIDAAVVLAACIGPALGALALWAAYRATGRSGG
jgi:phosphatidylglycerol lysyltransferase